MDIFKKTSAIFVHSASFEGAGFKMGGAGLKCYSDGSIR